MRRTPALPRPPAALIARAARLAAVLCCLFVWQSSAGDADARHRELLGESSPVEVVPVVHLVIEVGTLRRLALFVSVNTCQDRAEIHRRLVYVGSPGIQPEMLMLSAVLPNDEELAEAHVENDLGRRAAVCAAQDDGTRRLPPGQLRAPGFGRPHPLPEAGVPQPQSFDHVTFSVLTHRSSSLVGRGRYRSGAFASRIRLPSSTERSVRLAGLLKKGSPGTGSPGPRGRSRAEPEA